MNATQKYAILILILTLALTAGCIKNGGSTPNPINMTATAEIGHLNVHLTADAENLLNVRLDAARSQIEAWAVGQEAAIPADLVEADQEATRAAILNAAQTQWVEAQRDIERTPIP